MSTYLTYEPSTTVPSTTVLSTTMPSTTGPPTVETSAVVPSAVESPVTASPNQRTTHHGKHHKRHHGGQHRDGQVVETITVPELPFPLTSTFTTNFDLRKGSSHSSTAMGLSKERRASMDSMEQRPKLAQSHSTDVPVFDDEDVEPIQHQPTATKGFRPDSSLRDYIPASPWSPGGLVANCVICLAGIFLIYKIMEARAQPA